jgi:telomerase reverse transcriptase
MKRKPNPHTDAGPSKKAKRAAEPAAAASTSYGPDHPVLRRLYPKVTTLRHYLLSRLPKSSKNRRRRLSQLGLATPAQNDASTRDVDAQLGQLLDSALIGCFSPAEPNNLAQEVKERNRDIENFTQQRSQNTSGATYKPGYFLQSEVGRVTRTSALHVAMLSDLEAE